jgi:hypothetical protein
MSLSAGSKAPVRSQMKNFQEKKELIKLVMLKMMEEIMKNSEIY